MKLVNFTHFYVEPENVADQHFILKDDEAKHATRVLRLREGDELTAVDGVGNLYHGQISLINKKELVVSILDIEKNIGESELQLTIVQGAPKGNRFDIVIEKGTEIGVYAFQPIMTERSIINQDSRLDRWQQKAVAAIKQCGRSFCPLIHPPVKLHEFLHTFSGQIFIAHENIDESSHQPDIDVATPAALLIGPEGGFSENEFQQAVENGAVPLHLGKRRLRSETAALVGAVKLFHLANELN